MTVRSYRQYLALSPCSSLHPPTVSSWNSNSKPSCIQIWSFRSEARLTQSSSARAKESRSGNSIGAHQATEAFGNCELMICIDCGPATDLKWCPLPSHDPVYLSSNKLMDPGVLSNVYSGRRDPRERLGN